MKRILPLLFLLFCSPAFAKSGSEIATQIAPLLGERTAFFVHVDLTQIDLKTVCEEATGQLEPFLVSLNLDEKSIQGIAREAKKILRKGEAKLQKYLDTLVNQCGVSDVYFLAEGNDKDGALWGYFAIPLAGRTAVQREALVSFLKEDLYLNDTFLEYGSGVREHKGFQIFGTFSPERFQEFPDKGDAKVKTIFKDALQPTTGATFHMVVVFHFVHTTKDYGEWFPNPKNDNERQWNELMVSLGEKFQCVVLTFDVSRKEFTFILQTNSEADAKGLEQDYQRGIELAGELVKESVQENQDTAFLAPLVAEFLKGAFRAVQLKRDGSRFVFQQEEKKMFSMLINGGVGAAHFMLP